MGAWDYVSSTANAVKQYTVIPVWNLCSSSYSYGRAATSKIGNSIASVPAHDVSQFATSCAKNAAVYACREGLKTIPGGGSVFDIVSRSVPENSKPQNNKKQELQAVNNVLKNQEKQIKEMNDLVGKMRDEINTLKQVVNQEKVDNFEFESKMKEGNKIQAETIRYLMTKSLHLEANKQLMDSIQNMIEKGFLSRYSFDHMDMPKKFPEPIRAD